MAYKIKNHYIKTASKNSAEALAMAMCLICEEKNINAKANARSVQDLVDIINITSIKLKKLCDIEC